MKRITGIVALAAALAIPVGAAADQPTSSDKQSAEKQCKALLKAQGTSNFTHAWGAHGKGRAYGKCVSSTAKQMAQQRQAAKTNAAKQCKTEQSMSDADFMAANNGMTFAQKYGAKNASSAYGKCVATHAKQNQAEADQKNKDQITASKSCRGEQLSNAATFKTTYKNFGACVSKKAHELALQRQQSKTS
jgi:hypothetical protein